MIYEIERFQASSAVAPSLARHLDPPPPSQRVRGYGAMNRKDWRTVAADDGDFDAVELARQLVPTLRVNAAGIQEASAGYGAQLVRECREGLSVVLPLTDSEREFLDLLLAQAVIEPTRLTADTSLQRRIRSQPLLEWKALKVKRHKGLPR